MVFVHFIYYAYWYLFLFLTKNIILIINDNTSAKVTASQIPSIPKIIGSIYIIAIWNTSVLINEIIAETTPLFSAVKNDELYILNPLIMYDIENNLIALVVISSSSIS